MFRKNALFGVSSPEQLNKYIRVVRPAAWVIALSLFGVVAGLLVWAFAGSFTSSVTVHGVVFPAGGIVNVNAVAPGYVSDIRVRVGDYVQPGDLLAVIPQNNIIEKIDELKRQGAEQAQIEDFISDYRHLSFIQATHEGRITEVAEERIFVSDGERIATIMVQSKVDRNYQVLAFVPSEAAKNLKPGMEAQVSPTFAAREEYGYMQGYISSIASYPVTAESIPDGLRPFAKDILPESGFVEVGITLLPDAESNNLIKWSNGKGHTLSIDIGTACKILIITDRTRPIDKLF